MQCLINRISNRFNSTAAHLELYETFMPERFCENSSFPFNLLSIKDKNPAEYNYRACAIEEIPKFREKKAELSALVFLGVFPI